MLTAILTVVVSAIVGIEWGSKHPEKPFDDLCDGVIDGMKAIKNKLKGRKHERK